MLARLLVKGLSFVPGCPEKELSEKTFRLAVTDGCSCPGDMKLCGTPKSFIFNSYNSVYHHGYDILQRSSISEMFLEQNSKAGTSVHFVQKIYLMDVILNRSISPALSAGEAIHIDSDIVAVMRCFEDDDLMDSIDYKFRSCLAFIPS